MSDNTRREAASADQPHPARYPHPPQRLPAPRSGTWPDAHTAEALLSGDGCCTPPTVPADRLLRLLAAARDGHAPLDPAREAAALAAFRTAAAGRARKARGAGGRGGPLAALRTAFAVRRPRVMAAAVVSALALGGVAMGVAAGARSFAPGEGGGSAPMGTRPPAAVSPDGGTAGPWTAGPGIRSMGPTAPPAHNGADERRYGGGHHHGYGHGHGHGHLCHRTQPGHCLPGRTAGNDPKAASSGPPGSHGTTGGPGTVARPEKAAKADRGRRRGGHCHTRPGRRPPSRAPGR